VSYSGRHSWSTGGLGALVAAVVGALIDAGADLPRPPVTANGGLALSPPRPPQVKLHGRLDLR